MGVTSTLDVSLLAAIADGLAARVAQARMSVRDAVLTDWASNIEASEQGTDKPGQRDYDENLFADDSDPDVSIAWTDIEWAQAQEFGGRFNPPRPSLTQAVEAHRSEWPQVLAEAWTP